MDTLTQNSITILKTHLLSKQNVNYLLDIILKNINLSEKAVPKCENILRDSLNKYGDSLDRYPSNQSELLIAISYLNKKCYNDFIYYLIKKYPNKTLTRNGEPLESLIQEIDVPIAKEQIPLEDPEPIQVNIPEPRVPVPHQSEMIIIDEEEKNKIMSKSKHRSPPTDFLSYLTDPLVLQMFATLIQNVNGPQRLPEISAIISEEDMKRMILRSKTTKQYVSIPLDEPVLTTKTSESSYNKEVEQVSTKDELMTSEKTFNLDDPLTLETLPLLEKEMKRLIDLKQKYVMEQNFSKVDDIDENKRKIIAKISEFRNNQKKIKEEIGMKVSKISQIRDSNNDNIEFLKLVIDPTEDFNDLKNIEIKIKNDERKMTEFSLVEYYLPANENNVTRFNNRFAIYCKQVYQVIIPPGKYDLQTLIDFIHGQIKIIEITVIEKNKVSIRNTVSMKFDLMVGDDTIYKLLGFDGRTENYRENLIYDADKPYNMDIGKQITFCLNGTSMEPIKLDTDKNVKIEKVLKKSKSGFPMKKMVLRFTNDLDQLYDFIMPLEICFKITYQS